MTDIAPPSDLLRLKKLRFRAWRRGFREADFILGAFADAHLQTMSAQDLDAFETLLDQPDQFLYAWIIGSEPTPDPFNHAVMQSIRQSLPHTHRVVRNGG